MILLSSTRGQCDFQIGTGESYEMKPRLAGSVPYIPCSQGFRQSNRHIQIQRNHIYIYIEQYISYRCNHVYTYNLTNFKLLLSAFEDELRTNER